MGRRFECKQDCNYTESALQEVGETLEKEGKKQDSIEFFRQVSFSPLTPIQEVGWL